MREKLVNILSTKYLEQVSLDDLSPIAKVIHFDILEVVPIEPSSLSLHKNIIFTSYKATLRGLELLGEKAKEHHYFCVGKKSEKYLTEMGYEVYGFANYSKDLGNLLVENLGNSSFSYLCSEDRLSILPDILNENNVDFEEVFTYKADVCEEIPEGDFDLFLWFSPKGVKSYTGVVSDQALHVCIGETTATAVKALYDESKVFYPEVPRMESLIKLARNKATEVNARKCVKTVINR